MTTAASALFINVRQPITPGQITVFCDARLRLPNDCGRPNFFHVAATCYIAAIVAYHTGASDRLSCTLEHVVATALYPDYSRIIDLLQRDQTSAEFLRPLTRALESKVDQPLASVMSHVFSGLMGIEIGPAATERVKQLVG